MATSEVRGHWYRACPDFIELYGLIGVRSGAAWIMGVLVEGIYVPVEMEPAPVSESIGTLIEGDRAAGWGDLIASILMDNSVAVRLFLEGILTYEHFLAAREEQGWIVVPSVPLAGEVWTVQIGPETQLEYAIVTLDACGQIV